MDTIPDDTLELILLNLDSQVTLLRAASTCKRWRRVVAGDAFLRRFGSLHKLPAVAGSYRNSLVLLRPQFVEPSPRPTDVDSSHFSLDFLPDNSTCTRWSIKDSHGSLLLLEREHCNKATRDFIVCEPLTRRHQIIAPPAAACPSYRPVKAFFLGGGEDNGMSSFRALCLVHDGGCSHADVFCTGDSSCWRAVNINSQERYNFIGFGSRSIYWHVGGRTVFAMDKATAEFSSFLVPHVEDWGPFDTISPLGITVAVGSDGETRIALGARTLKVLVQAAGGEWVLEKSIQLTAAMLGLPPLERCRWYFVHGVRGVQNTGTVHIRTDTAGRQLRKFSIDIETMKVESLPDMDRTYPTKLPWPPFMHACNYHA
ncbi:unnamed protein product [Urochloa humidicola]